MPEKCLSYEVSPTENTRPEGALSRLPFLSSDAPQKDFIVDRPFVMIIEDTHTNALLFMGKVVSPMFTGLGGSAEAAAAPAVTTGVAEAL